MKALALAGERCEPVVAHGLSTFRWRACPAPQAAAGDFPIPSRDATRQNVSWALASNSAKPLSVTNRSAITRHGCPPLAPDRAIWRLGR